MPNGVRTNTPGLVVGLLFVGLGLALLLDRLGVIALQQVLQFWPLALVLIGGSLILQAIRQPVGAAPAPPVHFPVGAVIWLVLLGVFFTNVFERRGDALRTTADGNVRLFSVLGGDRRSVVSQRFQGGEMTSFMGGTILDLRQASVAPGQEAVVDVFTVMGGATVFVPKDWIVNNQVIAIMGGTRDDRGRPVVPGRRRGMMRDDRGQGGPDAASPTEPESTTPEADRPPTPPDAIEREDGALPSTPPRVVLRGFVMMGGLVIRS